MFNALEVKSYEEVSSKKNDFKASSEYIFSKTSIAKNEEEHEKSAGEAEELLIKENEDKDINSFFYIKGSGQPGDMIIAEIGIRGPSPVYRYNETTKGYDCVNYTAYKNIPTSEIKELQGKYPRHEITDQEESKGKEKIPADLEAQLNKINYQELFVTGDGKLFNIVHDNRIQISNESVKIFKDKLNQYANANGLILPQGFSLKPVTEDGIKEFEIWYSTGTNSSSSYPTAITFGP